MVFGDGARRIAEDEERRVASGDRRRVGAVCGLGGRGCRGDGHVVCVAGRTVLARADGEANGAGGVWPLVESLSTRCLLVKRNVDRFVVLSRFSSLVLGASFLAAASPARMACLKSACVGSSESAFLLPLLLVDGEVACRLSQPRGSRAWSEGVLGLAVVLVFSLSFQTV